MTLLTDADKAVRDESHAVKFIAFIYFIAAPIAYLVFRFAI